MFDRSTRILVVIDSSNFEYVCINNAVSNWERENAAEASTVLREAKDTDQENLPNLLNYSSFKRRLSESVQRKFDYLKQIVGDNHRDCVDCASGVDFVFVLDGKLSDNFRKKAYPLYKAQRKVQKKRYDVFTIKDYIQNVIYEEIGVERAGCRIVGDKSCECDDIVAVIMEKYPDYMLRVLFSSDRDFLQLKDVEQYNCWGERVMRTVPGIDNVVLSRSEFVLWKVIRGDVSDNIRNVFPKYGDKKSFDLVMDRERLNAMLRENLSATERFKLNAYLINFKKIPKSLKERVSRMLDEKLDFESEWRDVLDYGFVL